MNLTSLSGPALVRRLVIEPVWIGDHLSMSGFLADIGSGNGSPAIPLCLTRSIRSAHLIEARTRRSAFLRHLVMTLGITAEVHHGRFEQVSCEIPKVDWITLQAVHPTKEIVAQMQQISSPATTAVWITSTSVEPAGGVSLKTPFLDTQAIVFKPPCLV